VIGAVGTPAAVVERGKQVEVVVLADDEGGLDGIGPRAGGEVVDHGIVGGPKTVGGVETHHLQAPKDSQGVPASSRTTLGSMALKRSRPGRESITTPRSTQSAGSRDLLVARPLAAEQRDAVVEVIGAPEEGNVGGPGVAAGGIISPDPLSVKTLPAASQRIRSVDRRMGMPRPVDMTK
jgi:hypothetical protein